MVAWGGGSQGGKWYTLKGKKDEQRGSAKRRPQARLVGGRINIRDPKRGKKRKQRGGGGRPREQKENIDAASGGVKEERSKWAWRGAMLGHKRKNWSKKKKIKQ